MGQRMARALQTNKNFGRKKDGGGQRKKEILQTKKGPTKATRTASNNETDVD